MILSLTSALTYPANLSLITSILFLILPSGIISVNSAFSSSVNQIPWDQINLSEIIFLLRTSNLSKQASINLLTVTFSKIGGRPLNKMAIDSFKTSWSPVVLLELI